MADDGAAAAAAAAAAEKRSFATFFKRGKDKFKGKEVSRSKSYGDLRSEDPFNNDANTGSLSTVKTPPEEMTKAQIRRAQVRRAQIQHRQRKADYQKQLEMDVSAYREMIALAEKETSIIRRKNQALRDTYRRAVEGKPEMFGGIDVGDLTVTLSVDEAMGTPCFHISSSSSGESFHSPMDVDEERRELTPHQEQAAVNFILSLEHVCWDHFSVGDFPGHTHHKEEGAGHALMASTFCMSSAPESFYSARTIFDPQRKKSSKPSTPSPILSPTDAAPSMKWNTPNSISLSSLRGLASSLNPGDLELTPVQAWFELAERYPADVLLGSGIIDVLKRELRGVVKCVMFGAAMERGAFENVVGRVVHSAAPGL